MEDKDGNEIPGAKKKAIRQRARALFNGLLEGRVAPTTWGNVSLDAQNRLINTLETEFPILQLCENHWKSTMVATNSYSQWYRKACAREIATKGKETAEGEVINIDEEPFKQPQAEDDDTRPSKHPRLEETRPTPPRPLPTKPGPQCRKVCKLCFTDYMCRGISSFSFLYSHCIRLPTWLFYHFGQKNICFD